MNNTLAFEQLYTAVVCHQKQMDEFYNIMGRLAVCRENPGTPEEIIRELADMLSSARAEAQATRNALDIAKLEYDRNVLEGIAFHIPHPLKGDL